MRTKSIMILSITAVMFFTGCMVLEEPVPVSYMPPSRNPDEVQQWFLGGDDEAKSAVESALKWSKKYEELLAETDQLRQQNEKLTLENKNLTIGVDTYKTELEKTQKELYEANEFLKETHLELTNWKKNVLGFRDELRDAQAAELQALAKILRILGAEPVVATEYGQDTESSQSEG